MKPTGGKNYGSIGHLPYSRLGPSDHKITDGQAAICCLKKRDKHDRIIVQEKLDGSNVGVAKVDGILYPLTRAGYIATTSPYEQHHMFASWFRENMTRFDVMLNEGERAVGEWLYQAHGTRYNLPHEHFVLFDIMTGKQRLTHDVVTERGCDFIQPHVVSIGDSVIIDDALDELGEYGKHGAIDPIEGLMYRVERNTLIDKKRGGDRVWKVDYLAKFVKLSKQDGCYLESVTGEPPVINQLNIGENS